MDSWKCLSTHVVENELEKNKFIVHGWKRIKQGWIHTVYTKLYPNTDIKTSQKISLCDDGHVITDETRARWGYISRDGVTVAETSSRRWFCKVVKLTKLWNSTWISSETLEKLALTWLIYEAFYYCKLLFSDITFFSMRNISLDWFLKQSAKNKFLWSWPRWVKWVKGS